MSSVRSLLHSAGVGLRRDALLAVAFAALALLPLVMLGGWLVGGWRQPSFVPLLLDMLVLITLLFTVTRARSRVHDGIDDMAVARAAESHLSMPAGALRGAVELDRALPRGASEALAQRSERQLAAQMASVPVPSLTGALGAEWRRRRTTALGTFAILAIAVIAVAFVTPTRSVAAWTPLLHPVRNLKAPVLAPLAVKPGNTDVSRGGEVDVHVGATGRAAVTLHWRVQGDIVREKLLSVFTDTAGFALTHIDGATEYWVDAPDGAESAHFKITPIDPLLLSELSVEVLYPAYLNRANERYDAEVPALELPQGTELLIHGRGTRALSDASLNADSINIKLHVDDAAFSARWVPTTNGIYQWRLRDRAGNDLAVEPTPIALSIIRDAAPAATITFPGTDTIFGAELQLPVSAEATDDYGVASASLITWRVSRTGARDAPVETPLTLSGNGDRVLLQTMIDASTRNLTAGDTLKYFVRVRDNSPMSQVGDSRTFAIAVPGMAQLRDAASSQADALMKANAEIARAAAKLQEETRNTQRRTSAANAGRSGGSQNGDPSASGSKMQFAESQGAQKVLDQQQQLMQNMDEMRAKVDALQKSLENAGLQDADLQQKLKELQKLYDQAMTPEMRQKMDQLKQAIDKLDPKAVEQALKDLAQQQEQLKQQLERSMQLMQRAAAEQEMNRLSQETKELARQQDALASTLPEQKDPKQAQAQQADVARKDEALSRQLDSLKNQLSKQGEAQAAQGAQRAMDSAKAAQQSMQQAGQKSGEGKNGEAQQDARQAAQQLNDAAKQLDASRQQMAQGWKDETQKSMKEATRDALSLAQREQALKDQMDKAGSSTPKVPQMPQPQVGKQDGSSQSSPSPSGQQGAKPQNSDKGRSGGAGGNDGSGQKQGGRQGGPPQSGGQPQPGQSGQPQAGQQGSQPDLNAMRSEQAALQQGLQQLSKNLQDTGDRSAQVSRDVSSSLGRANQNMQQTQDALQNATPDSQLPSDQAAQTVDALNKLALSLLKNSQDVEQSQNGTGMQQAMQQMSELAKQQGSLNGQGSSLMPMGLGPSAMSEQVRKLGQSQQQIAQQLGDVGKATPEKKEMLGSIDELAKEAAAIAQEMASGRLEPQTMARQEKLFHRLLDAGRSLEKDEVSQERVSERPVSTKLSAPNALDPKLFQDGTRFRVPTPEELRALPPAYRKLILDYFERLNHPAGTPDKSK